MIGQKFWDISPLFKKKPPKPYKKIICPICGSDVIYFKHAYAFQRFPGQYRIDIIVKCAKCAIVDNPEKWSYHEWNVHTTAFGVHIDKETYTKLLKIWGKPILDYTDTGHVNLNNLTRRHNEKNK